MIHYSAAMRDDGLIVLFFGQVLSERRELECGGLH